MSNFKRKQKLINKSLQLKMVAVFAAIGCTCALFQVVLVNFSLLEIARESASGGDEILRSARSMMFENVVWTICAMIPLMTCVGIIITHRVAGPAYRMTMHCNEIAKGGEVRPCKIREDDELQELCDALNAMIATLGGSASQSGAASESWELEDAKSLVADERSSSEAEDDAEETVAAFSDADSGSDSDSDDDKNAS